MEVKGILHAHSAYSYDAKISLTALKALCQESGIQFVCMTEHTDRLSITEATAFVRECDALSDEVFRFIPGFEVPFEQAHILMIGQRTFSGNYAPTLPALQEWTRDTPFVVLAHPVRNRFLVSEGLLALIDALEVWNQQYEGKRVPRPRSLALFETLQQKKPTLVATGGVDLHRVSHFGAPFITLNIPSLTEEAILEKLKIGGYRVHSERASFQGVLPNALTLQKTHRFASMCAVGCILLGKFVNKVLATLGISFPSWFTSSIRKRV